MTLSGGERLFAAKRCGDRVHDGGDAHRLLDRFLRDAGVLQRVVMRLDAGAAAVDRRHRQRPHYRDIPQSVLPAPLSVEERQFRVDLQKFVISNIDDMVMKYERVLHVMMKTIHHGPGDPDEPLAVLATDAFNYTVMSEWGKLRAQATTAINQPDISSLILEIRNLFGVYQGSQKYITLFAAGSRIVVASMPETADWIAADARCQNALRDLQASPLGKDLKNIPVEVFASNRGMFNKGR